MFLNYIFVFIVFTFSVFALFFQILKMHQELKVIQWNCNRLPCKFDLFLHFLSLQNPDIVLLNELKMTEVECNYYSNIIGYESIFKARPTSKSGSLGLGGGVGILVKRGIEYVQDYSFDVFNMNL